MSPPSRLYLYEVYRRSRSLSRSRADVNGVLLVQQPPNSNHNHHYTNAAAASRTSQESLMSLMSGGGGGSVTPSSYWPSPLASRTPKAHRKSMTSDSSRGSGETCLQGGGARSSGGSRRSYPLNALYPPPAPTATLLGRHNSSATTVNGHHAPRPHNQSRQPQQGMHCAPIEGLELRPTFGLHTTTHFERDTTAFVGREWVFRDLYENLLRHNTGGGVGASENMVIQGDCGSGKTSLARHLVEHSPFYAPTDKAGSYDSGIAVGSRLSLYQNPNAANVPVAVDWLGRVSARIVAYHFCQIESGAACSVPEFVCNLGAMLANSPLLRPYADHLVKHPSLQRRLGLDECLREDAVDVFAAAVCAPLRTTMKAAPDGVPCIIVVDGLDEAEFHRPESTDSIMSFLMKFHDLLPPWIRLLVTVRTDVAEPLDSLGWRRINLDDAVLDERVARDARLYIDRRLSASECLRRNVTVTTGLSETDHPLLHFAQHMAAVGKGNLLYLRLTLDLLEQGVVRLKTANYSSLPVSLPEVFLLWFNRKFATQLSFERVVPILSVLLASLRPLDAVTLRQVVNSGYTERYLSQDDCIDRINQLSEFLVRRPDGTLAPFHPAFRDWLMRKQDGYGPKFLADIRQGHVLLALWLSRRAGERLNSDGLFELGHHLLKAHPYKYNVGGGPTGSSGSDVDTAFAPVTARGGASGRDCQLVWIQQSAADLSTALCSRRNVAYPNTKVSRLLLLAGASPNASLAPFVDTPPQAVSQGDLSTATQQHPEPLLLVASALGRTELVALLLEFGADVDATEGGTGQGRTALMRAAVNGHLDVVQILHHHGVQLSKTDVRGRCALVHAAEGGRVEVASFLLQCDWTGPRGVAPEGGGAVEKTAAIQNAFVVAAANGRTKMCQFLLEMADGIDLEAVSGDGTPSGAAMTALVAACEHARPDTVQYLLGQGADVRPKNTSGLPRRSPLIAAVRGGSWEIVSSLLAKGLDVNAECDEDDAGAQGGTTSPLMVAAAHGHIGVMELLLSRGASVDARDAVGLTALAHAAARNHPPVATLLLDRGAAVDAADTAGREQVGASVDARDAVGRTALAHAAARNHPPVATLLLDRGAAVDAADAAGRTALHHAAECAGKHMVHLLLERGAQLETVDNQDYRPLDLAVKATNANALQSFLRKGAKLSSVTWHLAQTKPDIALLLLQKLVEDGNLLYRRGRVKEAAHRYAYALRKCSTHLLLAAPRTGVDVGDEVDATSGPAAGTSNSVTLTAEHAETLKRLHYALLLGLARCRRRHGDLQAALQCCQESLQCIGALDDGGRTPAKVASSSETAGVGFEAYFLRAKCHFDLQRVAEAADDARTALRLNPASADARHLLETLLSGGTNDVNTTTSDNTRVQAHRSSSTSAQHQTPPSVRDQTPLNVLTSVTPAGGGGAVLGKSASPAECSSDSGNQADYDERRLSTKSPLTRNVETEL